MDEFQLKEHLALETINSDDNDGVTQFAIKMKNSAMKIQRSELTCIPVTLTCFFLHPP